MTVFEQYKQMLPDIQPLGISGRISGVRGLTASVSGFAAPVGASCRVAIAGGQLEARVIGFAQEQTLIMPLGPTDGICMGDRVTLTSSRQTLPVGKAMLGRVLGGRGEPIDHRGPIPFDACVPLWPAPIDALGRRRITEQFVTGLRAIDSMLTVGVGQRMGIFSGSGVGKSMLLSMIARHSAADVNVIALVGERGREVRDFLERDLGGQGLSRSVVVASTSDQPPLVRVEAGAVATAIAEFFRDRGCNVLLLVDSLTRLAAAQRQIGLVAGEPPTTKGYTPSVFSLLPQLLERSGRTEKGSITAFYTVLAEGDDPSDPVSDAVRSICDGHIHLSRELAQRGHYPAIDILQSISRVMPDVAGPKERQGAREIGRLVSLYREIEEVLNIGAYASGASAEYDLAIKLMPMIDRFLAQPSEEMSSPFQTQQALASLMDAVTLCRQQLRTAGAAAYPSRGFDRPPGGKAVPPGGGQ
jgi:FliI/YscN family ATPase